MKRSGENRSNMVLEVAAGGDVVSGSSYGRCKHMVHGGGRADESSGTMTFEGSSIQMAVGWQPMAGGSMGDRQGDSYGGAVEGIGPQRDGAVEITKHGEAKNGVNGDAVTQSERKRIGVVR
jgi:hypothetical protein